MEKISVVIITFNEERNITDCLKSVRSFADEILVVDSYSSDRTAALCRKASARLVLHRFAGHVQQKNFGVDASLHDWIFSLDADERASPELARSILSLKKKGFQHHGYGVNRLNYYLTDWIRTGGWYPDRKIRLFDRRRCRWQGENPHDIVKPSRGSRVGRLKGDLLHLTYPDLSSHLRQIDYFSSIAAKEKFLRKKRTVLLRLIFSPPFSFFKIFFLKAGFLSGTRGLVLAVLSSF